MGELGLRGRQRYMAGFSPDRTETIQNQNRCAEKGRSAQTIAIRGQGVKCRGVSRITIPFLSGTT